VINEMSLSQNRDENVDKIKNIFLIMHLLCIKNEGKIILKFKNEILGNKMI
jgi:hypothetical protein